MTAIVENHYNKLSVQRNWNKTTIEKEIRPEENQMKKKE